MKKTFLFLFLICSCGFIQAVDVEFPLLQSISYFPYTHHAALDKKDFRIAVDMYYSNIYTYDFQRTNVNDMETLGSTLALRYGLSDRVTLELYYRVTFAFGGIMDGLIVNFHKVFGLSEGGRNDYPRNRVNYTYKDAFAYSESFAAQSPPVLGVLGHIYRRGNFRLNGRLALGLPLSSRPGLSSGKPFAAAGLILLYKNDSGNLSAAFSNHLAVFKKPRWLAEEDLRSKIFHSEIRVDYRGIFAGLLYKSTPFKSGDLSNRALQVYFGVKIGKYFELALVEELPPMDTTPDVSFYLRINF